MSSRPREGRGIRAGQASAAAPAAAPSMKVRRSTGWRIVTSGLGVWELDHATLEPPMLALQHFLGQPVSPRVGVVRKLAELRVDAPTRLTAEQVREVHGAPAGRGVVLEEPLRPRARRRHG